MKPDYLAPETVSFFFKPDIWPIKYNVSKYSQINFKVKKLLIDTLLWLSFN